MNNNLSGVWSKANETNLGPFSKIGPKLASGNRPRQPGGAGTHRDKVGGDWSAGLPLPPCNSLLTLVSLSVNKGNSAGDDLSLIPTLVPTVTLCQ